MAACLTFTTVPGSSPVDVLTVDTAHTADSCPSQLLVMNVQDWSAFNNSMSSALISPWVMTEIQGAAIGGAILLVWSVAWIFRVFARIVYQSSGVNESE
jgi:hypothetical protein